MILEVSKLLHLLNRGISGNRIISSLSGSHSGGFPENHLTVRLLAGYIDDGGSISLPPYQPVIGKAVIFAYFAQLIQQREICAIVAFCLTRQVDTLFSRIK